MGVAGEGRRGRMEATTAPNMCARRCVDHPTSVKDRLCCRRTKTRRRTQDTRPRTEDQEQEGLGAGGMRSRRGEEKEGGGAGGMKSRRDQKVGSLPKKWGAGPGGDGENHRD